VRPPDFIETPALAAVPGQTRFNPEDIAMTLRSLDGAVMPRSIVAFSEQALTPHIVRRRAALAVLEAEMIAACETAALGTRSVTDGPLDFERWDRATWHRYLAAAMRLETVYGPHMRRLRQEIGHLERLMTLQIAA
jgi:hypothetical protein